jgi:glyoxylase-like metal-dependent hydrolase (beta-lactamase superfamily II)
MTMFSNPILKTIHLGLILLGSLVICAQNVIDDEKLHWWDDIDGFYNQQHKVTLKLVDEALSKYPPDLDEPLERKMAMLMLDGVLHEEAAPERPAVKDFLKRRITAAIGEIAGTEVEYGAKIWKLYNHGFVVRTPSVTIGFDLVPGNPWMEGDFQVEKATYQQLLDECDILFISHIHGDHANQWVAQSFISSDKPVIAPPEVWDSLAIHQNILHLKRAAHSRQKVLLNNDLQLSTVVYPGHQGADIQNNLVIVTTPEGISVAHTGDQSGPEDEWEWMDKIGENFRVDILFPNCWTPDILRMIRGVAPALVITGHENEMGHTVDHRESNWLTYTRLKGAVSPYILMTWGESYYYVPKP